MTNQTETDRRDAAVRALTEAVDRLDMAAMTAEVRRLSVSDIVATLERLDRRRRAVLYRVLPKGLALQVFESLDASLQGDLVAGLQDDAVAALFADLNPDDRVGLLDELPATVAHRLLQGLPPDERAMTADILGYPQGSIGRRMSPEFVAVRARFTVAEAMLRVQERLGDAETVYTLPVTDDERVLVGVVSLRDLLGASAETTVGELMQPAQWVRATDVAEVSARRCADLKVLALPVVDAETRLVGILTVDDALRILESADSEDQARISGVEPLRRPYLTAPVSGLVRSRVVWLLVLAIGATLTVQVLEVFEATLSQVVTLALFVPLLIGTGGNTGNQAATTVTRALALGDVRPSDLLRVLVREFRVGLSLGLLLGAVAFVVTSAIYDRGLGTVIALTLVSVCTMAATVGGVMPLVARTIRVDPAVFSNPFITTFTDATGLLIYFLIAKAVLGI
ncbi:magnesium transporter [Mycolicibacterium phlei]|uniref:Magnesium transporter MgtE n=1 Tax=Mycolicibacterium phlei DSM 43239 = CCUG 21000 TaxID=1226750 RepID=A0A5N5UZ68_MYCPH|nr:magnesium transporter [Mycolicibacterium phlei]VEG09040.1 magnesium transporter [Mycobacteroides chelonae]AMO60924.1 Magnesium transporter MgtE [Mycolicibacterium phlei]KAB7754932.1 magnesium transporter [Mycolicibacterium phlei DSM 43239 = CCUG 21000]KXW61785.1 magnesium transporter [Mycolicibacterium phlei DSM 43070]KXW64617.1 magnesium transporter [Mycolicibacterium phlei DSM 43239 = CCUG 21000]